MGLVVAVAAGLYVHRFIGVIVGTIALVSCVFWYILVTGPKDWDGYRVRPGFAFAGIILLILFILAAFYGMYDVFFIEKK